MSERMDRTFAALVRPDAAGAARAARATGESHSVSELARPFPVSLPAVMKHLDVLSDAGLVTRTKTGRTVRASSRPPRWRKPMEWLNRYQRFWTAAARSSCRLCGGRHHVRQPSLKRHRQAKPHPQTSSQCPAGKGLRRVDEPAKLTQVVRARMPARSKRAETDVRVGGRYAIDFAHRDGEQHHVSGVYREVVPNQKLVFTWAWQTMPERESLVTVADQARRRRHDPDADPRAVLRRAGARPPRVRLDRRAQQARALYQRVTGGEP